MRIREALKLLFAVVVCEAVGGLGSYFTVGAIPGWYATLVKPAFSPPNWVFGPVWTTLYALMGLAAYLVWRRHHGAHRTHALRLFALQLLLNGIWTPVFFGLRSTGGGLIVIIALLIAIIATTVSFWRLRPAAGILLLPYLAWVAFATVLNASLWYLN